MVRVVSHIPYDIGMSLVNSWVVLESNELNVILMTNHMALWIMVM